MLDGGSVKTSYGHFNPKSKQGASRNSENSDAGVRGMNSTLRETGREVLSRLRLKNLDAQRAILHLDSGTKVLYYKQSHSRRVFPRFEFKVAQLTAQKCKGRKTWTSRKR